MLTAPQIIAHASTAACAGFSYIQETVPKHQKDPHFPFNGLCSTAASQELANSAGFLLSIYQ